MTVVEESVVLCQCGCGLPAPVPTVTNRALGRIKGQPMKFRSGHNMKAASREGKGHPCWDAYKNRDPNAPKKRVLVGKYASGEDHYRWAGENIGYQPKHQWVSANKDKTGTCEHCGKTPKPYKGCRTGTDWANISGNYRRDITDYWELCRSCHLAFDGRTNTSGLTLF